MSDPELMVNVVSKAQCATQTPVAPEETLTPETPASARVRALFDAVAHNSTMAEMVGWRFVDFDDTTTTLKLAFRAGKLFCNPMGIVHGGFVGTMLDETMGSALVASSDGKKIPATISATIEYIRPAMCGEVHAVGWVRHMGGSIAFLEAELHDPVGRLLAKASGAFKIMDFDPTAFEAKQA